jgi:hypothetical protein
VDASKFQALLTPAYQRLTVDVAMVKTPPVLLKPLNQPILLNQQNLLSQHILLKLLNQQNQLKLLNQQNQLKLLNPPPQLILQQQPQLLTQTVISYVLMKCKWDSSVMAAVQPLNSAIAKEMGQEWI